MSFPDDLPFPGHHIWCNDFLEGPAENCEMCKGLKKDHPEDGQTEEQLMARYFPNNKKVTP